MIPLWLLLMALKKKKISSYFYFDHNFIEINFLYVYLQYVEIQIRREFGYFFNRYFLGKKIKRCNTNTTRYGHIWQEQYEIWNFIETVFKSFFKRQFFLLKIKKFFLFKFTVFQSKRISGGTDLWKIREFGQNFIRILLVSQKY